MEDLFIENDMLKGVWQYNDKTPREKLYPYLIKKNGAVSKTIDVSVNGKSNNYKGFTVSQFLERLLNEKYSDNACVRMMPASGNRSEGGGWLIKNLIVEKALKDIMSGKGKNVEQPNLNYSIEPILCVSSEELYRESEKIRKIIGNNIPKGQNKPETYEAVSIQRKRDANVVAYVLNIANGHCECCGNSAPFEKNKGEPFLEVHHVKHLADDGSDKVSNAVALCPNCHRELHYGIHKKALKKSLYTKVDRLLEEPS